MFNIDDLKSKAIKNIAYRLPPLLSMPGNQEQYYSAFYGDLKIFTCDAEEQLVKFGERASARKYNHNIHKIFFETSILFEYVNSLSDTINNHIALSNSSNKNMSRWLDYLLDELEAYESQLRSYGNPTSYIESFRSYEAFEDFGYLYSERTGNEVPSSVKAEYNSDEESIHLPYLRHDNSMCSKNGILFAEIVLRFQVGSGFQSTINKESNLDHIIDTSRESFWLETIMSDHLLEVNFNNTVPSENSNIVNNYYGVSSGALCDMLIMFESTTLINELSFLPCSKFPIDIVAIRYKETDGEHAEVKELVWPDNANYLMRSKTMRDSGNYKFPTIKCKQLFIVINQQHYVQRYISYDVYESFRNNMWFNLTNRSKITVADNKLIFKPNYLDKSEEVSVWDYMNDIKMQDKNKDLERSLMEFTPRASTTIKYEYEYGFYSIGGFYNELEQTGIYVSKPIQVTGNIKAISIRTDEVHPNIIDDESLNSIMAGLITGTEIQTTKVTDIEYYISYNDVPSYYDWHPIFPVNKKYIDNELLIMLDDDRKYCEFRFPAKRVFFIRSETVLLLETVNYTLVYNDYSQIKGVIMDEFNSYEIYVVAYEPYESASLLEVSEANELNYVNRNEIIDGKDMSYYELSEFPIYLYPDRPSTYISLVDKNTGEILDQFKGEITCVTMPDNPAASFREFDKRVDIVQYYTDGKHIYFNQNIDHDKVIRVNYYHYINTVRLKAILRRNIRENVWATPELKKIQYSFVLTD